MSAAVRPTHPGERARHLRGEIGVSEQLALVAQDAVGDPGRHSRLPVALSVDGELAADRLPCRKQPGQLDITSTVELVLEILGPHVR